MGNDERSMDGYRVPSKPLFKDDKEQFIYYEMLKVLGKIKNGEEKNRLLNEWKEKYKNTKLTNWNFFEIKK